MATYRGIILLLLGLVTIHGQGLPSSTSDENYVSCWTGAQCDSCRPGFVGSVNGENRCCPNCAPQGLILSPTVCLCRRTAATNLNDTGTDRVGPGSNRPTPALTGERQTEPTTLDSNEMNGYMPPQTAATNPEDTGTDRVGPGSNRPTLALTGGRQTERPTLDSNAFYITGPAFPLLIICIQDKHCSFLMFTDLRIRYTNDNCSCSLCSYK
ncbi:uncharacterized protein LOC118415619 [Branchiostoma floridae]|uniref:Uncharacterized protein LOC118415619 n=1 Tax=Branchiostoma floridae TaxID=7739 RepID=A0A9J7MRG4_BRAFL|nr:uncharacterized protein LOC118415619 [Branchiostoma floridae]